MVVSIECWRGKRRDIDKGIIQCLRVKGLRFHGDKVVYVDERGNTVRCATLKSSGSRKVQEGGSGGLGEGRFRRGFSR